MKRLLLLHHLISPRVKQRRHPQLAYASFLHPTLTLHLLLRHFLAFRHFSQQHLLMQQEGTRHILNLFLISSSLTHFDQSLQPFLNRILLRQKTPIILDHLFQQPRLRLQLSQIVVTKELLPVLLQHALR